MAMKATVEGTQNRVWSIALWIVQIALAVAYAPAGWFKMTMPLPELGTMMAWAADIPELLVRFIGAAEIAAAIGLVLPAATHILPGLSPLAAAVWSFLSFSVGAAVPLLPWLVSEIALVPTIVLSAIALMAVGAAATRVTHQRPWYGGLRQLALGMLSAAVTYGVGMLIGVSAV